MNNFVHLHLHTEHSLLDSTIQIKKLASFLKEREFKACAITDHGSLSGVWRFVNTLGKYKIKPIVGIEFYWVPNRFNRPEKGEKEYRYHVVALAKNHKGWLKLIRAQELAWTEGFYRFPRIDQEILLKLYPDCIILTACIQSPLANNLLNSMDITAHKWLKETHNVFGRDFWIEIQPNEMKDQIEINTQLIQIALGNEIDLVATCDSHYLELEHWETHDTLLAIRESHLGKTVLVSDPNRWRYTTRQLNVKTRSEMEEAFHTFHPDIKEYVWKRALDNTVLISESLPWAVLRKRKQVMPKVEVSSSVDEELERLVWQGWEKRNLSERLKGKKGVVDWLDEKSSNIMPLEEVYRKRVEWELQQIKDQGFASYFLLVRDLIYWAKSQNIMTGPGRGSVAGSLVAYLLEITAVDSIRYKCPFSRFIAPKRVDFPDIDLDFPSEERDRIKSYLEETYGIEQVASIANFDTSKAKGILRDVARVWGVPISKVNNVTKEIVEDTLVEAYEGNEVVKKFSNEYPEVIRHALELEGQVRHMGSHAAGIVVSDRPIRHLCPIRWTRKGEKMTSWDKRDIEAVGLLKLDILGIDVFSYIQRCLRMIETFKNEYIELEYLVNESDPKIFREFREGHTELVWQFNSQVAIQLLKKLQPDKFEHLVAASALLRPGPLRSGIAEIYLRKKSGFKIKSLDRRIDKLLSETYGVPIFQEDVMMLARELAGFNWAEADGMRKAIGKKIPEDLEKYKEKFQDGCIERGMNPKIAERIWIQLEDFAFYAFNRAHSTAYSMLSYWTMALKTYYPLEFLTAALQVEREGTRRIAYIREARRLGLDVEPPNVQCSDFKTKAKPPNTIVLGLSDIKGIRSSDAQTIVEHTPYEDLNDFLLRSKVSKGSLSLLLSIGALNDFCSNPKWVRNNLDKIMRKRKKQQELFSQENEEGDFSFSERELLQARLLLASYPPQSDEYMEIFRDLGNQKLCTANDFIKLENLGEYSLGCFCITKIGRTKTGRLKLTGEDATGQIVFIVEMSKIFPSKEPEVGQMFLTIATRLGDNIFVSPAMWEMDYVKENSEGSEAIRKLLGMDGVIVRDTLSNFNDQRKNTTFNMLILSFNEIEFNSGNKMGILISAGKNKIREFIIWGASITQYAKYWRSGSILRFPTKIRKARNGRINWEFDQYKSEILQILTS